MSARFLVLAAMLALLAGSSPPVLAAVPPAPWLDVLDAPFTRSQVVRVQFTQPSHDYVEQYIVSNARTLDADGHLTGTSVPTSTAAWRLADGPDGQRTVYGQLRYGAGGWSEILQVDLTLETDDPSSIYVDLDPQSGGSVIKLTSGHRWREIARSPTEPIAAAVAGTTGEVSFHSSFWSMSFNKVNGTLVPGTYELGPFDEDGDCVLYCFGLSTSTYVNNSSCSGTKAGSFTVNELTFAEGDVVNADIDFRVICRVDLVMAGSIRYGAARAVSALDQSADVFTYTTQNVGASSAEQVVTFTNIGDESHTFGAATFAAWPDSPASEDFDLTTDECSNATLALGETCDIGVTFTAGGPGTRRAVLQVPDETARGFREVNLFASGQQPTSLSISIPSQPTTGPVTTDVVLTVTPAAPGPARLFVDGSQKFGPSVRELTNPSRTETTYTVWLSTGEHTLTADYSGGAGYPTSEATYTFTLGGDITPPTGSISINEGAEYTNTASVIVGVNSVDESPIAKIVLTADLEGTWIMRDYYTSQQPWNLGDLDPNDPADGLKTVYAKWMDEAGNWSEFVSDSIIYDTHAPGVVGPSQLFVEGSSITNGRVGVSVPWSGDDSLSGVADYDLNQKTDSGAWIDVPLGTDQIAATPNSYVNRLLAPAHRYTFRVRATDAATNASSWAAGPTVNIKKVQESSARIRYTGRWRIASNTSLWGGGAKKSIQAGSRASITFTGRAFAWVASVGPDRGQARIFVDNVLVETVDLYSPTAATKRVVFATSWQTRSTHTVVIDVVGTAGRPAVDVDAFLTGE